MVENVGVSVVKNGCGHSVLRTLRLAVFKKKLLDFTGFWCGNKNSGKPKVTLISHW